MQIGFIGLGAMGLPMTHHLVEAGHQVTVASRSPEPVTQAVAFGAVDGKDPATVAAAAEITFLCLPNSPEVTEVVNAMLEKLGPDKTVVDCSTIDPDAERQLHTTVGDKGAHYLDAPLSGGTNGAQKGTLTVMVGGDDETVANTTPIMSSFAKLIVHVGGPGMGQVVKLCNNIIYAAQMTATAEATALAVKSGVDMAKLYEILVHATGDCTAVRTRLPVAGVIPDSPASNDWKPGFMTDLMVKDLSLALSYAGKEGVPLETTTTALKALVAASAAGYGREDFSSVAKVILGQAGVG
jgi:3-hydroxyisobutyrate dehydrogenase